MPGFTRQIILHTLTELMNEKPLSKITVKDIVERCGVNRNSFYYHFRDIPDAVEAMVKEELNDISRLMAHRPHPLRPGGTGLHPAVPHSGEGHPPCPGRA